MTELSSDEPLGRELEGVELWWSRTKVKLTRLRRKFPYLVWHGDEIDVRVTLLEDKLNPEDPMGSFMSGGFREIEYQMRDMGVKFDSGQGCEGRDWDWSLEGPISVVFRGRASRPHLRMERPKPKLVVNNEIEQASQ